MAAYEYDEAGTMALYFLITFLALVLVPLTLSSIFAKGEAEIVDGCQCTECIKHRKLIIQDRGSFLNPKTNKQTYLLLAGWSFFAFVSYKVSQLKVENKVYNPFEILGIKTHTPDKDIKAHFKNLSRIYHPDKVRATANLTIEAIQNRFVQITKAYKALTDEKIKENWVKYNNPDGPQTTSMGIALPKWVIEGKNNIWVLGAYGLVFGGALPAIVGRWWFGNRQKTKDGIYAQSAATFFKDLKEESSIEEVVSVLGKAYKWEVPLSKSDSSLDGLEEDIKKRLGSKWIELKKLTQNYNGELHESQRKALVLLYAHLLRLEIHNSGLRKQQKAVILQAPLLLNAILNVCISRSWVVPTLAAMYSHAFIAQALPPNASDRLRLTQLPGIDSKDLESLSPRASMADIVYNLEGKQDARAGDVKTALQKWGRVEIVEASFRVIGETIVTPSAIVYLLVKLRISPPGTRRAETKELSVDEMKRVLESDHEIDEKFLESRLDAEENSGLRTTGSAHAPHWPGIRKPSWWITLADDKSNRLVVPPLKVADIPLSDLSIDRDYRAYKVQFQGPPNTGLFTWRVHVVSDTFVGEETSVDITLKVENPPVADDSLSEDEISEPDEDSLAGQMAAMKGQPVKKRREESDDESGTDDDEESHSSDSDSD